MLTRLWEELNPSTLTGARDIVVVEHPDGRIRSSEWHVRFGKLGLLHHAGKIMTITINSKSAPFEMYVDSEGRGQFFETPTVSTGMTRSTSFPTVTAASVNIGPNDVRSILQEKSSPSRPSPLLNCPLLFRDTAIDLEAALDFEEPDPAPVSTVRSSFDFAQSLKGRSEPPAPADTRPVSPIPSALLLQSIRPILRPNENTITFTVSSLIQGPKTATASLFLWTPDVRLVVSDIDGTVTKSDVLGHILPPLGRDWTHPGLAALYTRIASLGVKFVYLTSRPIGEAAITRTMIQKIEQGGDQMPIGPIIMTPDAMFAAIQREVKRKPQEFKIPELLAINQLFEPEPIPWVLGFGNRKTDVISYKACGMTRDQIFLFNPKHEVLNSDGQLLFKGISAMTPEIDRLLGTFLRPRYVVESDDDL